MNASVRLRRSAIATTLALLWLCYAGIAVAQTQFTRGLLWQIEPAAGGKPSYVFGTIHSDDPRVTKLPPPVRERFNAADRDSVQRFYAESPEWRWGAEGRLGKSSILLIRSRLDRLASYPRWNLGYRELFIMPLAPGLAVVSADYRMGFNGRNGKPLVYDGALTAFWKHLPGGWKMVGGHTSTRPPG